MRKVITQDRYNPEVALHYLHVLFGTFNISDINNVHCSSIKLFEKIWNIPLRMPVHRSEDI